MILLSVLRTKQGFLTRLGLGVVMIPDEKVFRQRVGLFTGRELKHKTHYAEIQKIGENRFQVSFADVADGARKEFSKVYRTMDGALGKLSSIGFEILEKAG